MPKRKLSAIMFSDVVGYTSLMGEDEKKAFDTLKKSQRIHVRLIKKYKGRWLKEMGDGILASFSTNIDAVMCALSIQKAVKELDIPLRIGIHQGDVIFEKNDVLGDGVNIASRIQDHAGINGIAISETVYNNIRNKEGLEAELVGEPSLKGVKASIRIYKITSLDNSLLDYSIDTGELIKPLTTRRTPVIIGIIIIALLAYLLYNILPNGKKQSSRSNRSVLVLPFDNYTGSDTLEYFVAGMHNSLIGDIGKIGSLRVISQTTSNAYKDVDKSIPEIASELGINTVVEAAVMCLGDSVCLQVKVLSAYPEEKQLWVRDYYEEKSQILNLYNKVTREISEKIDVILTPQEESLLTDFRTVDPEAYDAYLKGQYYWEQLSPESLMKAMEHFQTAIDIDSYWGAPYAGMGMIWGVLDGFEFVPHDSARANQIRYLQQAFELDPNSANTHYIKALMATWGQWDWESAEKEYLKTLELNPSDALCRIYYAHFLFTMHRFDESVEQAGMALELDPLRPLVLGLYAVVMIKVGNYKKAIHHAEKAVSLDPDNLFSTNILKYANRWDGNYEKWFEIWMLMSNWKEGELKNIEKVFHDQGFLPTVRTIIEYNEMIVKKDGLISILDQAEFYLIVGEYDKAMDYFEIAYENRIGLLSYISNFPDMYPGFKGNKRLHALLRKMDLPVD